jgi:2-polyprenyl-3-methyl-5-hydroxy-6-metoxy-1,4-benzoquinol methylase
MMRNADTLPASYFEEKYKANSDPWDFRTSSYERDKYDETIQALTKPMYGKGLEVGCSIGVLTYLLSPRCQNLMAIDASETAIAAATRSNLPNVTFAIRMLPGEFPPGQFDLIVLSEVLYYFAQPDLELVANSCKEAISPGGECLLCHWLGETNYPLEGRQASDLFAQAVSAKQPIREILHDQDYRLERFVFS